MGLGNTYKNREEQVIVSQKMTVSSDEKVCIYKYNWFEDNMNLISPADIK